MKLNILYEDNHTIVVEKPVNIPVQEDSSQDKDLLNLVKEYIKNKYNKPGNVYLGLVHRLDRPTGGLVVFAKTSKAASRLSNALRLKQIERGYLAVVHGNLKNNGTLTDYLFKDQNTNTSSVVHRNKTGAKKAVLHYQVIKNADDFSLVSVKLETGRSHQIRVQFAHLGHPLYGDQRYGQGVNKVGDQLALFANELNYKHPTQDRIIHNSANPPKIHPWNLFNMEIKNVRH
ncbi:RluA family pseudouridine synthase [Phocicoccus pinnipedialis]|uniref:RNA pseudouridylate synthase n=1 Tax=Phocicoccus pinnipedialis TaxID=110845 RepID=A0A6V7RA70_9BACL|nr:RluA family pseudouridine synthase [Jeotgalicoccus pinnipedialis]MBP1940156.1 23S rRNA pseudouridine1911/1915/1917 synthase [Jeotgalicoccus pinnipedialis]CAD2073775.1 Ribosomal large subunit pseudouridine synthase D [Jeotgalicoccus pinnipedialis]